jgi:ribosomal protein L3 glutamine methyltransferase
LQLLKSKVAQRIEKRTPVAFLVGEAWFAGHKFNCDARALIPRSPIAELITQKFQALIESPPRRILDLCCGGGCIGIACAHEFPDSQVDLVDLSEDCLALAADNVGLHKLAERVSCIRSDLFSGLDGTYDLIVSNPPYVSRQELQALPAEYRHEPQAGLLSHDDGLQIPLTLLQRAGDFLSSDGLLIMEVGYSAELLVHRLPDVPFLWLEFEHGGEGVFALQAAQLRQYSDSLN